MPRIALLLMAAPILLGIGAQVFAQEVPNRLEEDNTLTQTYTTPHVPWGKGYVKGKVRALFFLPMVPVPRVIHPCNHTQDNHPSAGFPVIWRKCKPLVSKVLRSAQGITPKEGAFRHLGAEMGFGCRSWRRVRERGTRP